MEFYQTRLICDGPRGSLIKFLDYALLLAGSSFTIVEIEEDASPKQFFWSGSTHQAPVATELGSARLPSCPVLIVASPVLSVPSCPVVSAPKPIHKMVAT